MFLGRGGQTEVLITLSLLFFPFLLKISYGQLVSVSSSEGNVVDAGERRGLEKKKEER